ncbi:MAG TPA: C4-type zinc ribbon domain-containing protein [Anaerolineales bacterium]
MSAALGLFRLQKVDSRIAHGEARSRQIQQTLENDSELQAATARLKAAEQDEHRVEQERRTAEAAASDLQIKIQQAESSLYGGSVHNPKELQDFQADVISLKKQLTSMEEQQLEAMIRLESLQAAVQSAQTSVAQIKSRLGEDNRQLLDEQAALSRDLSDLEAERQAALGALDPHMLADYERLRQERRGVAVAEVVENTCGACGTTLTAALQQSARHASALIHCPSCGRILFAD